MARIKGKWVGQVVIEWDFDDKNVPGINFDSWREYITGGEMTEDIRRDLQYQYNREEGDGLFTVTQLHADLYRDEPSEWTKEEATL